MKLNFFETAVFVAVAVLLVCIVYNELMQPDPPIMVHFAKDDVVADYKVYGGFSTRVENDELIIHLERRQS